MEVSEHDSTDNSLPAKAVSNQTTETLVSCFPPVKFGHDKFKDILKLSTDELDNCRSPLDLAGLLVKRVTRQIFCKENGEFADLLATYRWAAANKARNYPHPQTGRAC